MSGQPGVLPAGLSIPICIKSSKTGVPIYGLNYKDVDTDALAWLVERGDPYRLSIADREGSLGLDLGVYGAPETYLVDRQGKIRYRHVGVIDDVVWAEVLAPRYQALLAEKVGEQP